MHRSLTDPILRLVVPKTVSKEINDYACRSKGVVVRDYRPIHSGMVWIDIFIESHCDRSIAFDDFKTFLIKLRLIHGINVWRLGTGANGKTLN